MDSICSECNQKLLDFEVNDNFKLDGRCTGCYLKKRRMEIFKEKHNVN